MSASPINLVVVTAADRAAATSQLGEREQFYTAACMRKQPMVSSAIGCFQYAVSPPHTSAAALSVAVDSHKPIGDDTPPLRRNQASRITHLKRQPLRRVIYLPKGPAKRLPRPGGKATSRRTVFPRKLCQRQFRMQLRQINLCLLRVQQQTDPPIPPVEKQEVKCSAPAY